VWRKLRDQNNDQTPKDRVSLLVGTLRVGLTKEDAVVVMDARCKQCRPAMMFARSQAESEVATLPAPSFSSAMSKVFHALAICSMLAAVILTTRAGTVWAEEQVNASTPTRADSQITSLLKDIESTLVNSPDVPFDDVNRMLILAQNLMPQASPQVRHLMQDFPARLRQLADEHHGDGVKAVTLTVFADVITQYFRDNETAQSEPALVQPPLALAPAAAKQQEFPVQPPVSQTPAPVKREAAVQATPAPSKRAPMAPLPAPAKQAAPEPPKTPQMSGMQHTLLDRGDAMLRLGDVSAARMLFSRAVESGIAIAALKMANTYDPAFLAEHNLRGIKADRAEAEAWCRKAQSMGEPLAKEYLASLERRKHLATD
jgi:DNA-binding transcriptional regulator YbjK